MELCRGAMFISLVVLAAITLVFSATDPSDLNVVYDIIIGLENTEILRWPDGDGDPCGPPTWNHLVCNGNRVSQIMFHGLNLKGQLPRNLNQLTMLTHLRFEDNQFTGQLPSFNGLDRLRIASFGNNSFDSISGDFLHGLKDLQVLALDGNHYNASSEGWSFPDDLQKLVQLVNLSCINCNLVGSLPDFLGDLSSLQSLKLSGNNLFGEIPDSIGNLSRLKHLNISGNQLVGLIPDSVANLSLDMLDLSHNKFMGPIPMFKAANASYSPNQFCATTPGTPCSLEVTSLIDFVGGLNYSSRFVSSWSTNDTCVVPWLGEAYCDSNQRVSLISLSMLNLSAPLSPTVVRPSSNNVSSPNPENWTMMEFLLKVYIILAVVIAVYMYSCCIRH